jgi:hypothetical protein
MLQTRGVRFGWGVNVTRAMNQENRGGDRGSDIDGTHVGDVELAAFGRKPKRAIYGGVGKKIWRPIPDDRSQIGECLRGDDRTDSWVVGRFLQGDSASERRSNEHDRSRLESIEHTAQVALLEKPICARLASGFAMRPAVVDDHIEPAPDESVDNASAARSVVRHAVKVHNRAAPSSESAATLGT